MVWYKNGTVRKQNKNTSTPPLSPGLFLICGGNTGSEGKLESTSEDADYQGRCEAGHSWFPHPF